MCIETLSLYAAQMMTSMRYLLDIVLIFENILVFISLKSIFKHSTTNIILDS